MRPPAPAAVLLCTITCLVTTVFLAHGHSKAQSDEAFLVKDINPRGGSDPLPIAGANGVVYLVADDGARGRALWRSDGTEAGTRFVAGIFPGAAGMNAQIAGQLKVNVDHVDEVSQIEASGKQVGIVAKLQDVDPYQHYDMLVTTKANVKAHYYDFVHLIQGDITATKWMLGNPGQAAQIATVTGDSVDVSKSALQHYLSINWWPYKTSGLTVQRLTRTIGLNVKLGVIPAGANLTWKDVVDTRMWKQANAALTKKKSST